MFLLTQKPWCNQALLHINRLDVHTHFWPFKNKSSALNDDKSAFVSCLSGEWAFRWFPTAAIDTQALLSESVESGWDTIKVPRSWQFAGYGKFLYTDEAFPFPQDPPYVPVLNETGVYRRTFHADLSENKQFILHLDGAESCCEIYVNGQFCGYTQGSRLPAEFDITAACRSGKNELGLIVHQFCDGTYLEDQDMWWLGGLIRDVYLIERCRTHIENVILDSDYDAASRSGSVRIRTTLKGSGSVSACLLNAQNSVLLEQTLDGDDCTLTIPDAIPWNAEEPYLYTLLLTLRGENGEEIETIRQRVGLRRIEIVDGELRLNNRRLMLRGVNRHEFSPKDGRVIDEAHTRADLLLMKQYHINAVRTSHYPDSPYFYDLCDELGLYVIDECDLETHGFEIEGVPTQLVEDPSWKEAYLDRAYRTVGRDRNHACVMLWSLGNESYWGSNFFAMYDWIHAEDPSRPIHYEGDRKNTHSDVSSTMYTTIGRLLELDMSTANKPHILCEFAHAMGNGPGSVNEYVETMEHSKHIQGYFVWEWRDHGVYTQREDGKICYRYGGEFGEDYNSGNFCMDGLLSADSTPTPGFYAYAKAIEPLHANMEKNGTLRIENRFAFRTIREASIVYTLRFDGNEAFCATENLPDLAPGQTLSLEAPSLIFEHLTNKNGHWTLTAEIALGDEQLGSASSVLRTYAATPIRPQGVLTVTETPTALCVSGEHFSLHVSLTDGRIEDYRADGRLIMEKGPQLDLFRAYTDNDRLDAVEWGKRHIHSMVVTLVKLDWAQEKDYIRIDLMARLGANARNWRVPHVISYTIFADGTVCVRFSGRFDGDFGTSFGDCVPRIGTTLRLPGICQQVRYCGFGPGETYCDSKHQARKDVFDAAVEDMSFPYECPQESGNRTDTDFAVLHDGQTGLAFAALRGHDMSVHTCTAKELWQARHACDVPHNNFVEMHFDGMNAGLGSASCGPRPLRGYIAETIPFDIQYAFTPIQSGQLTQAARHAQNVLCAVKEG